MIAGGSNTDAFTPTLRSAPPTRRRRTDASGPKTDPQTFVRLSFPRSVRGPPCVAWRLLRVALVTTAIVDHRRRVAYESPAQDVSVILGGPLYQLLRQTHLADDALELLRKRVLVLAAVA